MLGNKSPCLANKSISLTHSKSSTCSPTGRAVGQVCIKRKTSENYYVPPYFLFHLSSCRSFTCTLFDCRCTLLATVIHITTCILLIPVHKPVFLLVVIDLCVQALVTVAFAIVVLILTLILLSLQSASGIVRIQRYLLCFEQSNKAL